MPEENVPEAAATAESSEEPKAQWKYKKTLGINEEMKKVIGLTISATQSEIHVLRRKLEKLTYGS
jgi:hypothetical protein